MSEKSRPRNKAIEPDIVDEGCPDAPGGGGLRRMEQVSLAKPTGIVEALSDLFRSPSREARKSREWADVARAHTELDLALTDLGRSRQQLRSLPKILAADEEQRDIELARLQNQKAEEKRKANTRALDDEIAQKERLLQLAELDAKLANTQAPQRPKSESDKVREDFDRHFGKETAIRAEAQRRIEEVLKRAGGKITPEAAREIENINDYAQRMIDKL